MANNEQTAVAEGLLEIVVGLVSDLQRAAPVADAAQGATRAQLAALRYLAEHGTCSMHDLAAGVGVTAPTMTSTVRLLVKNGLVDRGHGNNDWRTVLVSATAAGIEAQRRYADNRVAVLARSLTDMAPEHRAMLLASLPALRALAKQVAAATVEG